MDEGKNITFKFNSDQEVPSRNSILEARAQRVKDAQELGKDIPVLQKDIQSYLNALNQFKKDYGELSKTQQKDFNNLTAYAEKLKKIVSDSNADYAKSIELVSEIAKFLDKSKDRAYELKVAQTESEAEYISLIQERNELEEVYGDIVEENAGKLERHKKAQESLYDNVHQSIKNLKNDVAQIATITGLDNIYNSLSGKNGQLASYNTMRSQFAMSKSDFNQFKREIYGHIKENGNLLKYGFQDALDYMNRLGELGITDSAMAKEQMDAIMLSTKYLGMSADTQTKILRQARNTGNMDLLNQTNQTMVQIMNAQLGVSRDQLDAIVNQSTELADLSVMFSGNPRALENFSMSASAIQSVYGESASKAAMSIAADLLNNGGSSKYISVLGENYGDIIAGLQAGDGRSLYQILEAVKTSNVSSSGASGVGAWSSISGSGYLDQNTLALYNSRAKAGTTYDMKMGDIVSASNDTNKFLGDMQQDFKTMVENATSWITAWIPLQSLQTIYYTLAIADMAFGVGKGIFNISKILGKDLIPGIKTLAAGSKTGLEVLGSAGANGVGGTGLVGAVGKILPWLGIIAGTAMAIGNGVDSISKSEELGVSKTSAFLAGFLGGGTETDERKRAGKNALGFGMAGAGIGFLLGGPLGALIGALIGGGGGAITGLIGTDRLATAMGDTQAPVTSYSYGRGDATVSSRNFPWTLTSPFGYRGTIMTSAGPTNPYHNGIDLAHPDGTPIGANNSGKVSAAGTANDGANYVIINSGDGFEQVYWHLNRPSHLKAGDTINAGQLVGFMGMTGHATGPHLHFGLRRAGTQDYIDPINSINATLFSPSDAGIPNLGVWLPGMSDEETPSTTVLKKMIDADTTSKEVQALAFDGVGSSEVVDSVNGGFSSLIQKLDELSSRQDSQERMLQIIAQGKGTNVYKY